MSNTDQPPPDAKCECGHEFKYHNQYGCYFVLSVHLGPHGEPFEESCDCAVPQLLEASVPTPSDERAEQAASFSPRARAAGVVSRIFADLSGDLLADRIDVAQTMTERAIEEAVAVEREQHRAALSEAYERGHESGWESHRSRHEADARIAEIVRMYAAHEQPSPVRAVARNMLALLAGETREKTS